MTFLFPGGAASRAAPGSGSARRTYLILQRAIITMGKVLETPQPSTTAKAMGCSPARAFSSITKVVAEFARIPMCAAGTRFEPLIGILANSATERYPKIKLRQSSRCFRYVHSPDDRG